MHPRRREPGCIHTTYSWFHVSLQGTLLTHQQLQRIMADSVIQTEPIKQHDAIVGLLLTEVLQYLDRTTTTREHDDGDGGVYGLEQASQHHQTWYDRLQVI